MLSDAAQNWSTHVAVVDADGPQRLTSRNSTNVLTARRRAWRSWASPPVMGAPATAEQLRIRGGIVCLLRVGAIPVMCLTGHRPAGQDAWPQFLEATALLIRDSASGFDYRPMAQNSQHDHPGLRHVIVDGDAGPLRRGRRYALATSNGPNPIIQIPSLPHCSWCRAVPPAPPKLIPRTHNDYVYNATASAALCKLTAKDVYMAALPAAQLSAGLPRTTGCYRGGRAHRLSVATPQPESSIGAIARHGVTVTALVPALANLWAQATEWEPEAPTSLRLLPNFGGAKLEAVMLNGSAPTLAGACSRCSVWPKDC